jgi:AcrR family transcriptional regulator
MEAALSRFFQNGYHGTTIQEIAEEAEFGIGTVYRHFPGGKEEIYCVLQEGVVSDFERQVGINIGLAKDEFDVVRGYIRAAASVYAQHPREMAIHLRETAGVGLDLGRGLAPQLAARYRDCADRVGQALSSGMSKGLFRKMSSKDLLAILRAMINAVFAGWLDQPQGPALDERVTMIEDVFFNGVAVPGS